MSEEAHLPFEDLPPFEEPTDWMDEMPADQREMIEEWSKPPPRWTALAIAILTYVLAGVGAAVIMLQWGVWFALTGLLWGGLGILIGGVIALAQIFLVFNREPAKESCAIG